MIHDMENKKYRKNIRLKFYDYSTNGYYFITICCSGRAKLCLNYKEIIQQQLKNLERYNGVKLDYYKIMPNHIHFILYLENSIFPLYRYVQDFKSKSTLQIKKNGFTGKRFWQPNYYEHIIRDEKVLGKIREYVEYNAEKERIDFLHFYNDIDMKNCKN